MLLFLLIGGLLPFAISPVKIRITYCDTLSIRLIYACFSFLLPYPSVAKTPKRLKRRHIIKSKDLQSFNPSFIRLRVNRLHISIATDRFDKTVYLTCLTQQIFSIILSLCLKSFLSVRTGETNIYPDFCSERGSLIADIELSFHPGHLIPALFSRHTSALSTCGKECA